MGRDENILGCPYDLHFLFPRLFSKWQRTSSPTWVSDGLPHGQFGEETWKACLASLRSHLLLLPLPPDDVSVLLQEIITEARNLSNAEM